MTVLTTGHARGEALEALSPQDQMHLFRELEESPHMGRHVAAVMDSLDPVANLNLSAMKAALNELVPSQYPETAGLWPVLRREVRSAPAALERAIDQALAGLSFAEKVALHRAFGEGRVDFGLAGIEGSGLGFWGAIVGSLVQVGGSVAIAKIGGDIQAEIAEKQGELAAQLGREKIAADKEIAEKKLAVEAALRGREIELAAQTAREGPIPGMPAWLLPVLLGVGGLVLFFFLKMRR